MKIEDFEFFRDRLFERRNHLVEWMNSADGIKNNDADKVREVLGQIKDALDRIENDSYGKCTICHDDIEQDRLHSRPETPVCLDCLSDREKRDIEDDMLMASRLQRALLPPAVPEIKGFKTGVKWLAASSVGGDYYDFLPCGKENNQSRIIIADAMGHGVSAGLLMSNLQGALRVLSMDIHSPGELISKLNQWLCRNVPITKFVSLACLCLERTDAAETHLTYVNAGHCPPVLLRSDGEVERLEPTGGILGVHEQFIYEEQHTILHPGDFLLLYTDGVTETKDSRGEAFEDDRLIDFVKEYRKNRFENILDDLVNEIARYSNSTTRSDDLTVLNLLKL